MHPVLMVLGIWLALSIVAAALWSATAWQYRRRIRASHDATAHLPLPPPPP